MCWAFRLLDMLPESLRLSGDWALPLVVAGYFLVHLFEHTLAPHFHFGEETHADEMRLHHAGFSALLGLGMHSFFDGVAIASGFLVSGGLGLVIFMAIMLHKVPEGFTVSSLLLAGGRTRGSAFGGAALLGICTIGGVVLMGLIHRRPLVTHIANFGRRDKVVRCRIGSDTGGEDREPEPRLAFLVFFRPGVAVSAAEAI